MKYLIKAWQSDSSQRRLQAVLASSGVNLFGLAQPQPFFFSARESDPILPVRLDIPSPYPRRFSKIDTQVQNSDGRFLDWDGVFLLRFFWFHLLV